MVKEIWSIWHKRNATRLQQASLPYSQVYSTAMSSLLLEFFPVTDSQHSPKSVARPNGGIPLCLLVIRQILTELCFKDISAAGIRVIIRDSEGQVTGSSCLSKNYSLCI